MTTALVLSCATGYSGTRLLAAHNSACRSILELVRIPTEGAQTLHVFPGFGPVTAAAVPIPDHAASRSRTAVLFALSIFLLLLIHRRVPLARNFVVFLMVLLVPAIVAMTTKQSFQFDSLLFTQIWLRGEILVWILLPWVSAFLFILPQPSVLAGLGWTLLTQIHGFVWSILRLVFCLGVLHHSGVLFVPLLWFCLGVLADLVYVLLFYSISVDSAVASIWKRRS